MHAFPIALVLAIASASNPSELEQASRRTTVRVVTIGAPVCMKDQGGRLDLLCVPLAGHGSGLLFAHRGAMYVMTNAHVIERARAVTVLSKELKRPAAAVVWTVDARHDVALLRLLDYEAAPNSAIVVREFSDLRWSSTELNDGAPITTFGFPLDPTQIEPERKLGRFSQWRHDHRSNARRIQVDTTFNGGNSGGPAIDAEGKIVGLVFAGAPGLGLIIPSERVRATLEAGLAQTLPAMAIGAHEQSYRSFSRAGGALVEALFFDVELSTILAEQPNAPNRCKSGEDRDTPICALDAKRGAALSRVESSLAETLDAEPQYPDAQLIRLWGRWVGWLLDWDFAQRRLAQSEGAKWARLDAEIGLLHTDVALLDRLSELSVEALALRSTLAEAHPSRPFVDRIRTVALTLRAPAAPAVEARDPPVVLESQNVPLRDPWNVDVNFTGQLEKTQLPHFEIKSAVSHAWWGVLVGYERHDRWLRYGPEHPTLDHLSIGGTLRPSKSVAFEVVGHVPASSTTYGAGARFTWLPGSDLVVRVDGAIGESKIRRGSPFYEAGLGLGFGGDLPAELKLRIRRIFETSVYGARFELITGRSFGVLLGAGFESFVSPTIVRSFVPLSAGLGFAASDTFQLQLLGELPIAIGDTRLRAEIPGAIAPSLPAVAGELWIGLRAGVRLEP